MAVPVQTPFIEYVANGVTTNFSLGFDCENQSHLIVTVDDIEPIVGSWSLSVGAVVFNSAPQNGSKIIIKRNSPFERERDFQLYDQSFRPPAVNLDLDRIWRKLQELGVMDWLLSNRIDDLKNYVDDRDDELRAYLLEEIRKQGVALDQLEDYYNYLMQRLAEIAVNQGWDASFVVDGYQTQKQINDAQKIKNTDYVTTKDFGAICDGTYHPLSEKFGSLAAAQVIYPFATSLAQSIDDVALQKALNDLPYYTRLYVVGEHITHSINTASSDPVVTSIVAKRKLYFKGVVKPNNDVKRFISLDAADQFLLINADGLGLYLSNVVRVTKPNCKIFDGSITNIYAPAFSAVGISVGAEGHGIKIQGNTIQNVKAAPNGTLGDGVGMCRAVTFDLVSPIYQSIVEGNTFDSITGEEGDAVTVVAKDNGGNYTDAKVTIRKNKIGNVNRRHVKVQANGVSVRRNYFYQTDDSIVLTNIQTVVDFVEGSNHKVTDNEFDSIKNFAQISVYQTDSSKAQSLITIKRNEFKGLKDAANAKPIISLSSVGATRFIVKDNDITCGTGRAISLGGAATVLVKGNDIDGLDNANESFITLASTTKAVVVDNTFIDGVRQSCILDTATGTVYKDNINMTTAPLIRDVAGSRGSHTLNNICYASAPISGTNGYKGNYFYQNIRLDSADSSYQAPMFFAGTTPETYLLDKPVKKGQIMFSTAAIAGQPIGYVATANGAANAITWKGFGIINN